MFSFLKKRRFFRCCCFCCWWFDGSAFLCWFKFAKLVNSSMIYVCIYEFMFTVLVFCAQHFIHCTRRHQLWWTLYYIFNVNGIYVNAAFLKVTSFYEFYGIYFVGKITKKITRTVCCSSCEKQTTACERRRFIWKFTQAKKNNLNFSEYFGFSAVDFNHPW